jgi:hypothetical protein
MRGRTRGAVVAASSCTALALLVQPAQASAGNAVAVYHMADPAVLTDSSGHGNNGTTTGITSAAGSAGKGYRFSGSAVASVPDSPSLDPGTATLRITTHVRFTQAPGTAVGDYDLVRKGLAGTKGGDWKVEIFPPSSDPGLATAYCRFQDAAHVAAEIRDTRDLADGRWHTIACVKTSRAVKLIVDGVSHSVAARLGAIDNNKPVTIGAKPDGDDQYLGDMDEVTIRIG